VLNRITGISLHRIVVAVAPFLVPLIAVDILLLVFPVLVLVLPRLLV
jgi:TRAP-type C4-dicarboxylate transport system permease large subunit